jgi:hypothetical protein
MRTTTLILAAVALFATSLSANADNRVATSYKGAPHVHNMTTPGVCPTGYNPGFYYTNRACIRCDYESTYYPQVAPPVCASCPSGYDYDPQTAACFPKPPKPTKP